MRRYLTVLAALAALQLLLLAAYLGVEALREEAPFAWEALDEPAPPLSLERSGAAVVVPDELHIVHFWATWCAPCQSELPGLLAAASDQGVPLLAVTDEPWSEVQEWFGGQVPSAIVRDRQGDAAARWQVSGLPDTYLVASGRICARAGGARDWSSRDARRFLREVK
jgi:thiol-disulfide isomerase/thioredoxin